MMIITPEDLTKLLLAVLIGGLIGAEREFRHRAAGFRTIIFICLGATLFSMLSLKIGGEVSPARIAAHMVTGVGFLCAGVVLEAGARIVGLTTASTIWLAAALGMGIGGGHESLAIVSAGVVLVILWVFPKFEEWIYNVREGRTYKITYPLNPDKFENLEKVFHQCGLKTKNHKVVKAGEEMVCSWEAFGSPKDHEILVEKLIHDTELKEFRF